jgi:hypothetical protein
MISPSHLVKIFVLLAVVTATTAKQDNTNLTDAVPAQHLRTHILDDSINRRIQSTSSCVNNANELIAALEAKSSPLIIKVCTNTIKIPAVSSGQGIDLSNRKVELRCNLPSPKRCKLTGCGVSRIFKGCNTTLTATKFDFVDGGVHGTVQDNFHGGAFNFQKSTITLKDCKFKNNTGSDGGVIYMEDSALTLMGKTLFEQNSALYLGGVMYLDHTSLTAKNGATEFNLNNAYNNSVIYQTHSTTCMVGAKIGNNFALYVSEEVLSLLKLI